MHLKAPRNYLKLLIPFFVGIVLLFVPLLGDFHIESALLTSLIGCFWAAVRACREGPAEDDFSMALKICGYLFLAGIPLCINALITGCFTLDGLAFWVAIPLPGVFFGYAIGRLLRIWSISYRRLISILILLVIAIGFLLAEFLRFPQVYFFNHVWGVWPGPIYDEAVHIGASVFFFRAVTILWAALLWYIPVLNRDRQSLLIVIFSAIAIGFSYTQFVEMGIVSPRFHLQQVLGGYEETEHFKLYYAKDAYSRYEIKMIAKEHEFYLNQISQTLNISKPDSAHKVESYLYAHPWQKKALTGAKFTSYVPVWLEQDQLHIAKPQVNESLKHELVHVLAKQFGNRLFNASWSIGLIEGLAVALENGSSNTSTIDQIVVSQKPYPSAKELKEAFSPSGFYGGRSGVNYYTSGSFVDYLLVNYPKSLFKKAYKTGSITGTYPVKWEKLVKGWQQHLDTVKTDSIDEAIASRIFAIPSLFEQQCPRKVSDFGLSWDNYRFFLASHDTAKALTALDKVLGVAESTLAVKAEWGYRNLLAGNYQKVQKASSSRDTTINLQLLYADAFAMTGEWQQAEQFVIRARKLFEAVNDSLFKPALKTRSDRKQWNIYRYMAYENVLPDSVTFALAYYRTKIRSLKKAIDKEQWKVAKKYGQWLLNFTAGERYFDAYQQLIHWMALLGERQLAEQWIKKATELPLRMRYRQRLKQELMWIEFLESSHLSSY